MEGGTQSELQSGRKEGSERRPLQQVLRGPPALGTKELKVDASSKCWAAPDRAADQSNTGADQVSTVEEWNCGTWKEEPWVASPERNGIPWKRVATPASSLPESNAGRGARASTDNLVRASGSDGPWHTESEEATATRPSRERFRGVVARESEMKQGGSVHRGAWHERAQERDNSRSAQVMGVWPDKFEENSSAW